MDVVGGGSKVGRDGRGDFFSREGYIVVGISILETGELSLERKEHIANSAITMFSNDDFGHAAQVTTIRVGIDFIILWSMNEAHHIGILLNGTRLTKVREQW